MEIKIDDLKIYYKVSGSGKNLILLHGWRQDQNTWNLLAPYLAEKYRVWRLDLPAFGLSDAPKTAWSTPKYADFLDKFIRANKIRKTTIIAHSFGARSAIFLASQKPKYLDKLVLINPAGLKPKKGFRKQFAFVTAKVGKIFFSIPGLSAQKKKVKERFYSLLQNEDYLRSGILKEIFNAIINEDLIKNLKRINNPTLLIWGKNDTITPVSDAKIFNKNIKKSKLEIIEKSAHFPYIENQYEFVKVLEPFLKEK